MKKRTYLFIISIVSTVALSLILMNIYHKNNNSKNIVVLSDTKELKSYYESFLKGSSMNFIEYTSNLSFENTTTNLLLMHEYNIDFNVNTSFDEASKIFNEKWDSFNNSSNIDKSTVNDEKVHLCYYYLTLAKELNKHLTEDTVKKMQNFYNEYITKEISKKFISKTVEMCIKDRLSFIGGYLNDIGDIRNINQTLLGILQKDFSSLNSRQSGIEDLMNIMYTISAMNELGNNTELCSSDLQNSVNKFINSDEFTKAPYYEKALFLNKFLSICNSKPNFDLNKESNNILSCFRYDLGLSSTLKFECIKLLKTCSIGNEVVKSYLNNIPHNKNYGFYQDRILIPTYKSLYYSLKIEEMIGADASCLDNYVKRIVAQIHKNSNSFEEMYYSTLLCKENKSIQEEFKDTNDSTIDQCKNYVINTKIDEQNFVQYYYAIKILLLDGNTKFAENHLKKLEYSVDLLRKKYGNEQNFKYIEVMFKDILSYYPKLYPNSEQIWNEALELNTNNFYLDNIEIYTEIGNRLNKKPSSSELLSLKSKLEKYKTLTGFCPINEEKYTTLQATYNGLCVESYIQSIK